MGVRFAFAGFRHGHAMGLYRLAQESDEVEVVAASEEDAPARERLNAEGKVKLTHSSFDEMLGEVSCDVIAIGDYFAKRGSLAIRAMEAGRHVMADKPLCTRLDELDRIEELARAKDLKVGLAVGMRSCGQYITLRKLVQSGDLGEVGAITFNGQHSLNLGARPGWYFEPGKHGGTINDIGVHAFDYVPWATGMRFSKVVAARCWNAFAVDYPHFKGGAQAMLTLENGCGVLGDVSYFKPSRAGYPFPLAWRFSIWGRKGVAEATSSDIDKVLLALSDDKQLRYVTAEPTIGPGYLKAFLADVAGGSPEDGLDTESVLTASRIALTAQKAADENLHDVDLSLIGRGGQ